VLFCTCHGSIFSAVTGEVINGPAQGSLQLLDVCVGGGYVFVTIPLAISTGAGNARAIRARSEET
jgi:Rieske Fe-S protein